MTGCLGGRNVGQRTGVLAGMRSDPARLCRTGIGWGDDDQTKRDDRPERGIAIYTDFPGSSYPWERASVWT